MSEATQFEFEQVMSRTDVAAYLRRVADTLEADGTLSFSSGQQSTTVTVPPSLEFEVSVEREAEGRQTPKVSVEFELEWGEGDTDPTTGSLSIE